MAEFRLRPGDYRPDAVAGVFDKKRSTAGNPDVAFQHYEGPHGPLEVYAVDGLTATVVRGAAVGEVRLEWGLHAKNDRKWHERLQHGLSCSVGGVEVRFARPRSGLSRRARAIEVTRGDMRYVSRVRGVARHVLEREDGTLVARYPDVRRGGWLDDRADAVDAVIVVLLLGSNLVDESVLGWMP